MEKDGWKKRLEEFLDGREPVSGRLQAFLREVEKNGGSFPAPDRQKMWDRICRHIAARRRKRLVRHILCSAAACILLALVPLLHTSGPRHGAETAVLTAETDRQQVRLLLHDGNVLDVQQFNGKTMTSEQGGQIHVDADSGMVYRAPAGKAAGLVYNTVQVPASCEYHLVLADGSEVWLNSATSLRFPVGFTTGERRVFLEGEACFKVARDRRKPFRVETSAMTVEALGTVFNVNAYPDESRQHATLVEGRVRVGWERSGGDRDGHCTLEPGEQLVWAEEGTEKRKVDCSEYTSWMEGRFTFNDMRLEDIGRQLERWYDVELVFETEEIKDFRFTGVVKKYNGLQQVTDMIGETTDVSFHSEGRTLSVRRKR